MTTVAELKKALEIFPPDYDIALTTNVEQRIGWAPSQRIELACVEPATRPREGKLLPILDISTGILFGRVVIDGEPLTEAGSLEGGPR